MGFLSDITGGLLGGGGGSNETKVTFQKVPQTEGADIARARLEEIAAGPLPEVPLQGVAPLQPLGEERQLARSTAKELIQPMDFLSLPEVQGIIQNTVEKGDLLANRLGRMLQTAGSLTSTPGRDILGRTVKEVEGNIAAALAPFAAEERARRTSLIPVLEGLGLTQEDRIRGVEQAGLTAQFQQETTQSNQIQNFLIPLLERIIALQPGLQPIIQSGGSGGLGGLESLIGPIIQLLSGGGGSAGPALVASGGGGTSNLGNLSNLSNLLNRGSQSGPTSFNF